MNEQQKRTIIDFALGRCRKETLVIALGFDVDTNPHAIFKLLNDATCDVSIDGSGTR